MMDPVHPWVDPGEMRRMAEALLLPPVAQTTAPDDAGFGGEFVGYAAEQLRAAVTAAVSLRAPTPVVPPPVHVATPPVPPAPLTPSMAEMTRPVFLQAEQREVSSQPASPTPVIVAPAALVAPVNAVVVSPIAPSVPESTATFQHMAASQAAVLPTASPFQVIPAETTAVVPTASPFQAIPAETTAVVPTASPFQAIPAETTAVVPPASPVHQPAEPIATAVAAAAPVKMRGPFLERMARFRDGLHGQFAAKGMFILDKEGAVIFDEADHAKLHFMARSLAMAAKKSNDGPGNVHVKVGSTTMLEVIPVDTVFGRMVLGVLVEQSLSSEAVYRIIKALQIAVSPPKF
jgi:hypothetical protein